MLLKIKVYLICTKSYCTEWRQQYLYQITSQHVLYMRGRNKNLHITHYLASLLLHHSHGLSSPAPPLLSPCPTTQPINPQHTLPCIHSLLQPQLSHSSIHCHSINKIVPPSSFLRHREKLTLSSPKLLWSRFWRLLFFQKA